MTEVTSPLLHPDVAYVLDRLEGATFLRFDSTGSPPHPAFRVRWQGRDFRLVYRTGEYFDQNGNHWMVEHANRGFLSGNEHAKKVAAILKEPAGLERPDDPTDSTLDMVENALERIGELEERFGDLHSRLAGIRARVRDEPDVGPIPILAERLAVLEQRMDARSEDEPDWRALAERYAFHHPDCYWLDPDDHSAGCNCGWIQRVEELGLEEYGFRKGTPPLEGMARMIERERAAAHVNPPGECVEAARAAIRANLGGKNVHEGTAKAVARAVIRALHGEG